MIYESPDKGKTVYAREFGKTERQLVSADIQDPYTQIYLWHDIVHAARDNPALQEALDQALLIYKMIKETP